MAMTKKQQAERDAAIERLRNTYGLRPGSTVHTTLTHVSRSGMSRSIKAIVSFDGSPRDVSSLVARAIDHRVDDTRGGVKMGGAGMDMGFALVYALSRALFPNGYDCTGEADCPANDHVNDYGLSIRTAKERLNMDPYAGTLTEADHLRVVDLAETIRREELGYREGRHHSDGGYALNHRWL